MVVVGTAFGGDCDVTGLAELGCVSYALHANFTDRFDGEKLVLIGAVAGQLRDRNAVDAGFRLRGQTALNGEAAAVVGLDAGQGLKQHVWAGAAGTANVGGQVQYFFRG